MIVDNCANCEKLSAKYIIHSGISACEALVAGFLVFAKGITYVLLILISIFVWRMRRREKVEHTLSLLKLKPIISGSSLQPKLNFLVKFEVFLTWNQIETFVS